MDDMRSTHGTAPRHPHGGDGTGGAYTPGNDANPQQGTRPAVPPGEGQISDDEQANHSNGEATTSSSKPTNDGWTSFGGIATTGQSDIPIYDIEMPLKAPDFVRKAPYIVKRNHNFKLVDGVFSVKSHLMPVKNLHLPETPFIEIERPVFQTKDVPLDESQTQIMAIEWGMIRERTLHIDDERRAEIQKANRIDLRSEYQNYFNLFHSALSLCVCSVSALGILKSYDNFGMYAKLIYWALVLDYQDVCGQAVSCPPFGSDDTVKWVNIDSENPAYAINRENFQGSIILREGTDFSVIDLQTILWLAREGSRVRSAPGVRTPDMSYVKWPSINVCLVGRGEAPVWPEAAPLTSSQILSFAESLAQKRGEQDDLCRGLYCALDICGVRYGERNNVNFPLGTFLSPSPPNPPEPRDNIYPRMLGILPSQDLLRKSEYQSWNSATQLTKIRLAATYVALMQSFTTTYLYSLSLSTRVIVDWASRKGGSTIGYGLLNSLTRPDTVNGEEALLYTKVKNAVMHFTGYSVEVQLYPHAYAWGKAPYKNGSFLFDTDDCYRAQGCIPEMTPRLGSVLAIDDFLKFRPQEWGVLGGQTTCDITESIVYSSVKHTGLYAHKGDSTYDGRLVQDPYLVVPYGVYMLNAVAQCFSMEGVAPSFNLEFFNVNCIPRGNSFNNMPEEYEVFDFNQDLHIYEPCSIWTFDIDSSEVRSPVVRSPLITDHRLHVLMHLGQVANRGLPMHCIGFMNPHRSFSKELPPEEFFESGGMTGAIERRFTKLRQQNSRSRALPLQSRIT